MDDALFEVELDGTLSAYDQDYDLVSRETVPSQAESPKGVDRLTMWVPSERVVVNLGAPVFEVRQASPGFYRLPTREQMKVDGGFVAQTDAHAHLYTYGALSESSWAAQTAPSRTFVRLGVPSALILPSFRATLHEPKDGPPRTAFVSSVFADDSTPHKKAGYAMITEGHAVHESIQNHFVTSSLADVRVVGQRAVVVTSPGDVFIGSIPDATTTELLGDADQPTLPTGPIREALSWFADVKSEMETIQSEGLRIQEEMELFRREPLFGCAGWEKVKVGPRIGATLGHAIDTVSMAMPLTRFLGGGTGGSVNAYGNFSISLGAGVLAGLHSDLLTSIGGRVTTISAGGVLSLSSAGMASISATHQATLSSNAVSINAQLGSASLRARSTAEISSSHGNLIATSLDDAQLNSLDGTVYVHGRDGFVLTAGAGDTPKHTMDRMYWPQEPGFGVIGTDKLLYLGHVQNATAFRLAMPDATSLPYIKLTPDGITIVSGGGVITLSNSGVTLGGGGVSIELGSGGIKLKSS
ncbi:MAG: hypothetical protein U0414_07355 [Polyangiaceae bacterium]